MDVPVVVDDAEVFDLIDRTMLEILDPQTLDAIQLIQQRDAELVKFETENAHREPGEVALEMAPLRMSVSAAKAYRLRQVEDSLEFIRGIGNTVPDAELQPACAAKLTTILEREHPLGMKLEGLRADSSHILATLVDVLPRWTRHTFHTFRSIRTRKAIINVIWNHMRSGDIGLKANSFVAVSVMLRAYDDPPPRVALVVYSTLIMASSWATEGAPREKTLEALDLLVPTLPSLIPTTPDEQFSKWFDALKRFIVTPHAAHWINPCERLIYCWEHIERHRALYEAQVSDTYPTQEDPLVRVLGCPYRNTTARSYLMSTSHTSSIRRLWDLGCKYAGVNELKEIVRHVLWPRLREHVRRVRPIAIFWLQCTAVSQYAEDGAGRKRDAEAYVTDGFAERPKRARCSDSDDSKPIIACTHNHGREKT